MNGRLVERTALSQPERARMLELLTAHFDGVTPRQFTHDLEQKQWVILLEDDAERLRGFSTLLTYEMRFGGEPLRVVYSGDTIVDREAWGTSALARTWIGSVNSLREVLGEGEPWFWLLVSSGIRTYRFLPLFWREFFPRFDAPARPALLDFLARDRFGDRYDASRGVVRLASPQVLRSELREIPARAHRDPHAVFFLNTNPGWIRGDELACLCELSHENLTAAGRRMVAVSEEAHAHRIPG